MHPLNNVKILLVEDHRDLAESVIDFLETTGCIVDYAADGITGLHLARTQTFDAIILDWMLPGMSGVDVCQSLREQHELTSPVLMMTARDELNDKLQGFESGADVYLVKPFDLPELVARIQSLIRRDKGLVVNETLTIGDLDINTGARSVKRSGQNITLTPAGYQILLLLARNTPNVVTREQIEQHLWGDEPPASDTLRSQIYKLRKSVDKPFETALIETVQATGFRLTDGTS